MNPAHIKGYLLEPKAPLIIRSGRPFDEQAGADAARFPPPSTLAGALRTAYADSQGLAYGAYLADIAVQGPLPVLLDLSGKPLQLLVPKPVDAHYCYQEGQKSLLPARPTPLAKGLGCDLPVAGLLPVQLAPGAGGKAAPGPQWWAFTDLVAWRQALALGIGHIPSWTQIVQHGWTPPPDDIRTHVQISRQTQAAESGQLFQTAGLNFWQTAATSHVTQLPEQAVGIVAGIAADIQTDLITLGGERRLAAIRSLTGLWPTTPVNHTAAMVQAGGFSLTLLTPALFAKGWRPGWLDEELCGELPGMPGLRVKLRAAALERWQPHSGWDLAKQQPRAGRKLIPAGATYWFEFVSAAPEVMGELWLPTISDQLQDRLDGFGLALAMPWAIPASSL
jgi:CRISPR-associated protein Cmr3